MSSFQQLFCFNLSAHKKQDTVSLSVTDTINLRHSACQDSKLRKTEDHKTIQKIKFDTQVDITSLKIIVKGLLKKSFYKCSRMSLHTDETDEENGYRSYKVRSVLETSLRNLIVKFQITSLSLEKGKLFGNRLKTKLARQCNNGKICFNRFVGKVRKSSNKIFFPKGKKWCQNFI